MANWVNADDIILLGVFEMKIIEDIFEWIIIVIAFILLVIPEILYSYVLRARDKIEDCIRGL